MMSVPRTKVILMRLYSEMDGDLLEALDIATPFRRRNERHERLLRQPGVAWMITPDEPGGELEQGYSSGSSSSEGG